MRKSLGTILLAVPLALAVTAEAQQPAGHQPDEVAAVLEAMDRYLEALAANDMRAMEQMQTADGMTYRATPDESGRWTVRSRSNLAWVAPSQSDGRNYLERYWSPTVLVRGAIAVVWAPYEFWIDGATSHCGVDVFSFAKIDGAWKLSNSMWTVEPNGCAELRPSEPSGMRPPERRERP
jgi:hypothetical protein